MTIFQVTKFQYEHDKKTLPYPIEQGSASQINYNYYEKCRLGLRFCDNVTADVDAMADSVVGS